MRACCNKKEDNFITYHENREKIINHVRDWEKLNPEQRKEYTIKYYKTEKGHRKRLAQQKRYREKRKLIKENEKLKNDKMELLERMDKAIEITHKILMNNADNRMICNDDEKEYFDWLDRELLEQEKILNGDKNE